MKEIPLKTDLKTECLTGIIAGLLDLTAKRLSDDVFRRLKEMRTNSANAYAFAEYAETACANTAYSETTCANTAPQNGERETERRIYDAMFTNLEMAAGLSRPCCQDTGVVQFFVEAGTDFPYLAELPFCLREAVIRATDSVPLRPNVVECFDEKNTGNNTGKRIPWIDWELIPYSDAIRLYVYLAGGGCSLPGFARVFMPIGGYEKALKAIVDQIVSLGPNACPPLIAGIGFAGQADAAARLSKKALLRFIGTKNTNPKGAELEDQLLKTLNSLGMGPAGFAGNNYLMAVHIEEAGRHTASLAAALSVGCWVHRRSLAEIRADLSYEILSHKGIL